MNFSRFFNREQPESKEHGVAKPEKGLEHIAPTEYFTPERVSGIEEMLGKLSSIHVDKITPL